MSFSFLIYYQIILLLTNSIFSLPFISKATVKRYGQVHATNEVHGRLYASTSYLTDYMIYFRRLASSYLSVEAIAPFAIEIRTMREAWTGYVNLLTAEHIGVSWPYVKSFYG
jgi:hypothetical protein